MKRLDRYVLAIFVPALLLFCLGLLVLAVSIDTIVNRGDFARLQDESPTSFAVKYYLLRLPMFLRMILPFVPLFAAALTVVILGRTNQLTPIVSSGMSLRRVYVPFLIGSVLCAFAIAGIEEWVLPPLMPEIAETEALLAAKEKSYSVILSDRNGNHVFAPVYDHSEQMMSGDGRRGILVVQIGADGLRRRVLHCEEAWYDGKKGGWVLYNGEIKHYVDGVQVEIDPGPQGAPRAPSSEIPADGLLLPSDIEPAMIRRGADMVKRFVDFESAKAAVAEHREIPELTTRLVDKFTYPFSAILILMLGLPFVSSMESKSLIGRSILTLLACAGYFVTYLVGQDFANQAIVPSVAGCWGPTVLFGCLAAAHYGMIRT